MPAYQSSALALNENVNSAIAIVKNNFFTDDSLSISDMASLYYKINFKKIAVWGKTLIFPFLSDRF